MSNIITRQIDALFSTFTTPIGSEGTANILLKREQVSPVYNSLFRDIKLADQFYEEFKNIYKEKCVEDGKFAIDYTHEIFPLINGGKRYNDAAAYLIRRCLEAGTKLEDKKLFTIDYREINSKGKVELTYFVLHNNIFIEGHEIIRFYVAQPLSEDKIIIDKITDIAKNNYIQPLKNFPIIS